MCLIPVVMLWIEKINFAIDRSIPFGVFFSHVHVDTVCRYIARGSVCLSYGCNVADWNDRRNTIREYVRKT